VESARSETRRALLGGVAIAAGVSWPLTSVGAVAPSLAQSYGVSLATVGLFTTALLLVHVLVQVPGGRAVDRLGARRLGIAALVAVAAGHALALLSADPRVAIAARAAAGLGTGAGFIAGSEYIRARGFSPLAQGLYGGAGLASAGLALAIVPQVERLIGWRAPYVTALACAAAAVLALVAAPNESRERRVLVASADAPRACAGARLFPLAVMHAASFGLGLVAGNWVVALLTQAGGYDARTAGALGALTLVLGVVARPLGGWLPRARPESARRVLCASLVAGALGNLLLGAAPDAAVVVLLVALSLVGLATGIPFASAFTGAAAARPDAPGAALGLVNTGAMLVALVGTPLLGLSFSLPGDGRAGFLALGAVTGAAILALPSAGELGASGAGAPAAAGRAQPRAPTAR
jgi:MFS family permease